MACIGLGLPILSAGLVLEPAGCCGSQAEGVPEARWARQLRERRAVEDQHRRILEATKRRRD